MLLICWLLLPTLVVDLTGVCYFKRRSLRDHELWSCLLLLGQLTVCVLLRSACQLGAQKKSYKKKYFNKDFYIVLDLKALYLEKHTLNTKQLKIALLNQKYSKR